MNINYGTITEDSKYTTVTLLAPKYKIITAVIDNNTNNGSSNKKTNNNENNNDIQGAVKTSDESNIYLYITLRSISIFGMRYALRNKFINYIIIKKERFNLSLFLFFIIIIKNYKKCNNKISE